MTTPTARALPILFTLLTLGCSSGVGEVACRDFVETIGDVAERCGFDRAANEQAVENNVTRFQGCSAVVEVRDEAAFYDGCLPFIESLTCAQFDDPTVTFPASCSMQLAVR